MNSGMELWRLLTRADKVLIAAVLLGAAALFIHQHHNAEAGRRALVEVEGRRLGAYALSEARIVRVQGALGPSIIEIAGGRVRIKEAPCPQLFCVRRGWIDRRGDLVACIPNRLVVRVEGRAGEVELDGISR